MLDGGSVRGKDHGLRLNGVHPIHSSIGVHNIEQLPQ
jgi:hypothetical protein